MPGTLGHVININFGALARQLPGEIIRGAGLRRTKMGLAALLPQQIQQFRNAMYRQVWIHRQHKRLPRDKSERQEVSDRIVTKLRVRDLHQRMIVGADKNSVAVCGRTFEDSRANGATSPGEILDHDRLAESLRPDTAHYPPDNT